MKKSILSEILVLVLLLTGMNNGYAQQSEISKEFKVLGNCNGCKKRIEKGAMAVEGVSLANWDKETKIIRVTMAENVDVGDVSKAIGLAGHDTEFDKAQQAVYDELPGCCQYDRETESSIVEEVVKTITFGVAGNCGMCKKKIEKAAKSIAGVSQADWDKESKFITVGLSDDNVSKAEVSQAIAAVGYDTEFDQADQTNYDELPGCCHYDRLSYKED